MAREANKPFYIDPAGEARMGSLPVRPPFRFTGVTSRVFPLKANMARLTLFCDQYVNMDIPLRIAHYRPAVPYVYLMVLDYGSMSSASMHAQNVGWVSQHEVAFTVPLERWQLEDGKLVFKDWACVSPFIFVDDEISLTTGREVYGWPKVAGQVEATKPLWDRHPMAGSRLFTFSTAVFPKVYAGEAEAQRVLLQIDTDPAPSFSQVPPDPDSLWSPWAALALASRSSLSLMGNALDMTLALRARGYRTNRSWTSMRAMSGKAADYLRHLGPSFLSRERGPQPLFASAGRGRPKLAFDNVTIKQFRDAQSPDQACYKALVRSTMGVERINHSGLLGDVNLLRGDTSGGYSIRVHRYTSQPIIESLGIEATSTENRDDGVSVAVLKPTFPFWTDVDLYYGSGHVICSRTHTPGDDEADPWIDERTAFEAGVAQPHTATPAPAKPAASPSAAAAAAPAAAAPAEPAVSTRAVARGPDKSRIDYNTALGAATQPVAGPFHFPDVTLQVYPLLAARAQLDRFVQRYLNKPLKTSGLRFETMGSYVYLMVQVTGDQIGTMWSSANDIGWWADREVSFCVPVKWFHTNALGEEELVSVAMIAPFVYSNNGRAVISDREVNGRPAVKAIISSPKDVWLDNSGPGKPRQYLQLQTEVFPAMGYGQKAEPRTLLEIDGKDVLPYNDDVGWRMVGERWGPVIVEDLVRKTVVRQDQADAVEDAKALALEVLAHGAPINWLVLKQVRDAAKIERACYQALVHTQRAVTRIYDVREIEDRLHVRLHRYPGHPIVETLGLQVKSLDSSGGKVVQNLQPLRPFWMRISVREELGIVAAVHRAEGGWALTHPWFQARPGRAGTKARAAAMPYFRRPEPTRVSRQWDFRPQRLVGQAQRALREALAGSLQGATQVARALPAAAQAALMEQLPTAQAAALAQLLAADFLPSHAEAYALEDLVLLERALIEQGLLWQPAQTQSPRLSRNQARQSIQSLGEIQVVLECILSAEWEHWGNPRWYRGLPAKPEQCIPSDSVANQLKSLVAETGARSQPGALLEATHDKAWLFAPPAPKPSASPE